MQRSRRNSRLSLIDADSCRYGLATPLVRRACAHRRAAGAIEADAPRRSDLPRAASSAPARRIGQRPDVRRPRIVVLGDSLTAGLGLSPEQAYPALLQQKIDADGLNYEVVNAGVSGDTSAGGSSRLDWALEGDVRVLVVALGGNDGLRGLPADGIEAESGARSSSARRRSDISVVLAGMEAPPNFGQRLHRLSFTRSIRSWPSSTASRSFRSCCRAWRASRD